MAVTLPNVVSATYAAPESRLGDLDCGIVVSCAQFIDTKYIAAMVEEKKSKCFHLRSLAEESDSNLIHLKESSRALAEIHGLYQVAVAALSLAPVSMSLASASDAAQSAADIAFNGASLAPVVASLDVARQSRRRSRFRILARAPPFAAACGEFHQTTLSRDPSDVT